MLRSEITRINELRTVITDDPGDLEARRQPADTVPRRPRLPERTLTDRPRIRR
ncbi:hypothetical protein Q0Z83_061180 [Actinoplanes sichuanensis]|nr:hypothetical protein Q0Z83_061180 [Actinoplanes sichuanensis]